MNGQAQAGVHCSAWKRAVAMVERKLGELQERQAELQQVAEQAERDLAFARIWGDPVPVRRGSSSRRLTLR